MTSYEHRTWWSAHDLTVRLRNPSFLEAAVIAAFVLGAADGGVSAEEYDALLDRLQILGDVDRDAIDGHLTAAARALDTDGFEPMIARAAGLLVDRPAREAALLLSLAIALADDDFSPPERAMAARLCAALGLADVDLDGLVAVLRG
ncbi:MAG: TerB family tellurite resistance protein [Kofleriaceae bacterium]